MKRSWFTESQIVTDQTLNIQVLKDLPGKDF